MENKEISSKDRRVRRTRRALEEALIGLILEKGYEAVTIEEITDRADLGRTTFYLHFKDKEELLMHAIDSILEDFIETQEQRRAKPDFTPGISLSSEQLSLDGKLLRLIFQHVQENADLYKIILRGEGGQKTLQRFSDITKDEFMKRINYQTKSFPEMQLKVPSEVFGLFFAGTLIQMVTWWLENDQPYSIDEMVQFFLQMFVHGADGTLNLSNLSGKIAF